MSSSVVRRSEQDGVITLTPNRPSRLNAITPDLLRALTDALQSAAVDDVAVVLRGEGRAFCAGWDLKDSAVRLPQDTIGRCRRVPSRSLPSSTDMLGAGSELRLGCDLIIAGESARFGFPEAGISMAVTNGMPTK